MDHQFYTKHFAILSYSRKINFQSPISICSKPAEMGQACGNLQSTFRCKTPAEKVRAMTSNIYDRVIEDAKKIAKSSDPSSLHIEKSTLTFDEMHSAVVQFFQELDKNICGANYKIPTKEQVQEMLKSFGMNKESKIGREEFSQFIQKYTVDLVRKDRKGLLIMSVTVPAAAIIIKWATDVIPQVPTPVFATVVTSAALLFYCIFKK